VTGHEQPQSKHPIAHRVIPTESSSLIKAALHVLADGRARGAGDVLSEAMKAGLLPGGTRRITLYTSVSQHVQRAIARRRRPLIVQDETTHEFRINHPVDDWPHIKPRSRPAAVSADAIAAIAHRSYATSTSTLPESFEKAVCDALDALGFVATHHGGIGAPDGVLEAPLGPLAFRAIVECKTPKRSGRHDGADRRSYAGRSPFTLSR
jgi:hypothetical protein